MHSFAVYYIEANIVCIIVFGIMLTHNYKNIDRQEKQVKFDHVLNAFMAYFLVDCFWALITAKIIPKTRFTVVVNVFLIYIAMAAITYTWLDYVMAYEQVPNRDRPIHRFAVIFPFLISTTALILNYIFAPDMLIDESLNTKGTYSIYLVAVPYIYMAAILFYTIRKARTEENIIEKKRHLYIGLFPLMVIAGGFIQILFFPYIPIYCFTCMILMLIFYIQSIEHRVSIDPLTNLNNRGQLARYISQASNLHQEGKLTVVIMMDIDDFKTINDTYGHAEGDKALILVSDSLKKTINSHSIPAFMGRYGGDEFILIIHPVKMEETIQLINEFRNEIDKHEKEKPYPLTVSIGYDKLEGQDSFENCVQRADKNLYQDKAYRKQKEE
ncbi:MAG: GGDEF domain-containing protein [Anaerolineaceae bacterium]|nr:GGDEF domain-containing protein [Anaerolineaceae bacterium]